MKLIMKCMKGCVLCFYFLADATVGGDSIGSRKVVSVFLTHSCFPLLAVVLCAFQGKKSLYPKYKHWQRNSPF